VIIISPNFGAIDAPQLGHFSEVAVEGASTCEDVEDTLEACPVF